MEDLVAAILVAAVAVAVTGQLGHTVLEVVHTVDTAAMAGMVEVNLVATWHMVVEVAAVVLVALALIEGSHL